MLVMLRFYRRAVRDESPYGARPKHLSMKRGRLEGRYGIEAILLPARTRRQWCGSPMWCGRPALLGQHLVEVLKDRRIEGPLAARPDTKRPA
jgi:hypothetical protein